MQPALPCDEAFAALTDDVFAACNGTMSEVRDSSNESYEAVCRKASPPLARAAPCLVYM